MPGHGKNITLFGNERLVIGRTSSHGKSTSVSSIQPMNQIHWSHLVGSESRIAVVKMMIMMMMITHVYKFVISVFQELRFVSNSFVLQIRSSSYLLLASLCQVLPDVAIDNMKKLSPCILLNLDENDVVVSGSVWEAVLSLINISSVSVVIFYYISSSSSFFLFIFTEYNQKCMILFSLTVWIWFKETDKISCVWVCISF